MLPKLRTPAAVCQRPQGPGLVKASALNDPENTCASIATQPQFPGGFDPAAMPILAAHWFGSRGGDTSGPPEAGRP